jgi:transcriptional regulator with XRE-family HTH domain
VDIVGVNIRRLRKDKSYTLRELGEKVGVSSSFISQVEIGKISPSLSKLKDIANALNTTIGLLVGETDQQSTSPVIKKTERRQTHLMGTGLDVDLLSTPDPNKQMEPFIVKFDHGASSGSKQQQHFGQVFIYILNGKLRISLNNKHYEMTAGDSIYFNSNIPHSFANISKNKTEALWVVTPPTF